MKELKYLELQERLTSRRLERALTGAENVDSTVELFESAIRQHPLLGVGGAFAIGGMLGAVLARAPGKSIATLGHTLRKPAWSVIRRALLD